MAKVTVIPSTINPLTQVPIGEIRKRRVAAYARVSTDSDEQYTSYEAQCNKYTEYIKSNPQWEFVKVYADEGITGTNRKKRVEFNKMIEDAKAGLIDLIVTKSISRFARNTVDTISLTRELKKIGVEVFFEKENIWSLEDTSEFILTVLASAAQEESRSISENVKMGKRWAMQEGKVSWAYSNFLGFEKCNDKIVINEEEARIVRMIYQLFLFEGKTCLGIANILNEQNIPTPSGKRGCKWTINTVKSILTNEKYKGDCMMQKTFVVDFLEHKHKKNQGEIPQYYAVDTHPSIIEKEEWEMVQSELARRKELGATYSGIGPFASKIICGDCGAIYGAKVWHSTDKYKKVIYRCNNKYNKKHETCKTPILTEERIKELFIKACNEIISNKQEYIELALEIKKLLTDTTEEETIIVKQQAEIDIITETASRLVKDNSFKVQNQDEYQRKYDELTKRYNKAKKIVDDAVREKERKAQKALILDCFINKLSQTKKVITEWSSELWNILLEKAKVNRNGTITFIFKNGKEIII